MIASGIDNSNSVLFGTSRRNLDKLQKVQNAAARLVMRKRKHDSISNSIKELHWLRV